MRTFKIGADTKDREVREAFNYAPAVRYLLCNGGRRIAVWLRDEEHDWRSLMLADAATGEVIEYIRDIAPEYGGSIVVCRDGTRIVYQNQDLDRLWHYRDLVPEGWADTGPIPPDEPEGRGQDDEDVDDIAYSCKLAASADGATVVVVATREEERRGRARSTTHADVWTIPDNGDPTLTTVIAGGLPAEVRVAVSVGPRPLTAFAGDGRVIVRDATTGGPVTELTMADWTADPSGNRRDGVRFSDNGRRLVAFYGRRIFAWDTADWSPAAITLSGGEWEMVAVAVSPDGRTVAATDDTKDVRFFDAATGTPGSVIRPPATPDGWDNPAGLSFSADGAMCLLGFSDGTVAVWDVD